MGYKEAQHRQAYGRRPQPYRRSQTGLKKLLQRIDEPNCKSLIRWVHLSVGAKSWRLLKMSRNPYEY